MKYENRRKAMRSVLEVLGPDILAVQEMLSGESAEIFNNILTGNFNYRCSKFGGTQHQGNCVFWDNKKFRIKEVIYPDADMQHPPVAVYLEDKTTGFDFFIISVHLKYGKSVQARVEELGRILEYIKNYIIPSDQDVIIAGDFNLPVKVIREYLSEDEFTCYITEFTSRKKNGEGSSSYDHFIVSKSISENNLNPDEPQIAEDTVISGENEYDNLQISDHFPVIYILDINLPELN